MVVGIGGTRGGRRKRRSTGSTGSRIKKNINHKLTTSAGAPTKLASITVVAVVGEISRNGSARATRDSNPTIDMAQLFS